MNAKAITLAALAGLLVAPLLAPTAVANHDGNPGLWQCDEDPITVARWAVAHVAIIVNEAVQRTALLAGKTKCTTLHVLGVCGDESLSAPGPVGSTGDSHTRVTSCREYFVVHAECPGIIGGYRRHTWMYPNPFHPGFDDHSCHRVV